MRGARCVSEGKPVDAEGGKRRFADRRRKREGRIFIYAASSAVSLVQSWPGWD